MRKIPYFVRHGIVMVRVGKVNEDIILTSQIIGVEMTISYNTKTTSSDYACTSRLKPM